ncbi:hypothetical protein [Pseudofrankia inefficax]|uniref:Uncharacterized protein n=1 Tax=Pseudofrankia inefficax (strain DSM 45817 / CECT 9037 / DDB 130130 / EuI1c) TaxID=298654 RepID=E3J9D9_PSEI1|nr:hypothetical protein [Pseudofrankia inefficax]ADP82158.1 hypothetical protein FraEuI1c_4157 [Pseudofrankia inefficax]
MSAPEPSTDQPGPSSAVTGRGSPGRAVRTAQAAFVLIGLAGLVYGVHGALGAHRLSNPSYSLKWAMVAIVLHDAVLIPALAVIGWLLARLLPAPYRAVTQAALFVSGSVALMSLPLWRGYTSDPGNPTVDPLPYGRNLLIVLAAVWVAAAAAMVVLARRRAPESATEPEQDGPTA